MNEKSNNSKGISTGVVLLIILVVGLISITGGIYIGYRLQNKNPEIEVNLGNTTNPENITPTENEAIESDTIDTNKYMSAFKYDLKNNQVSNFDIAFLKAENSKENKVYSPLSIKYTLKMLEEGATGRTKQQISNVLEDYTITKYTSNKNMSLANALFVNNRFKDNVKQSYITNLKNKCNADLIFDSFTSTKNVNDWVKNKTLNIIPEILKEIDENQDFLLINALGIDMEWKNKFFELTSEFAEEVVYNHENYYARCNINSVESRKFDNDKLEVSGMESFASIDNYDIVNILGEESIRKTVEEKYRAWINEHGTNAWGETLTGTDAIEKEISDYLDKYMESIKNNYTSHRVEKSTDFSIYTDDVVKVFAKDLKEYNGTTLQYVGIMPTNQDLDKYIKDVDSTKLNNIISNLKELKNENFKDGVITRITAYIPKFNFEYTLKLKADLEKIGITDIFDADKADISELTSATGEYISDAIHKANIEFTQEGIKAAAVTYAPGKGGGEPLFDYIYDVPIEDIDLTFDKPYMFIIRDKDTGDVWFTGTVYEPLEWNNDTTKLER